MINLSELVKSDRRDGSVNMRIVYIMLLSVYGCRRVVLPMWGHP
ncbi:hypothetical protein LINPERHAP1_LOCUS15711 [Linum perenne]